MEANTGMPLAIAPKYKDSEFPIVLFCTGKKAEGGSDLVYE